MFADESGVCQTCSGETLLWSPITSKCVAVCPAGLTAVDEICPTCYGDADMRA